MRKAKVFGSVLAEGFTLNPITAAVCNEMSPSRQTTGGLSVRAVQPHLFSDTPVI